MTEAQLLPVVWTLASMTVAVLAILLVGATQLARLRATTGGRFLEQFLRLVYFIGVPYAALLTGSIASIDMGLTGAGGSILGWSPAEWLHGLSTALMLGVIVLLPIGLAGRQIARAGQPLGLDDRSAGAVIVDAIYAEIHWAFYRAAPLILLSDIYTAVLFGVMLVGVEWIVVLIRNGLSPSPEERQSWLRRSALLAVSAALFALTRNVWLAIILHATLELLWKVWLRRLVPRPIEQVRSPIGPVSDPDVRPLHDQP
ncbi:MAG TPA: hypothetical protein VMP08_17195 [Anaerolineae bacterium]|nr:hypothetical protein [Anaerolineae bacterium]